MYASHSQNIYNAKYENIIKRLKKSNIVTNSEIARKLPKCFDYCYPALLIKKLICTKTNLKMSANELT